MSNFSGRAMLALVAAGGIVGAEILARGYPLGPALLGAGVAEAGLLLAALGLRRGLRR